MRILMTGPVPVDYGQVYVDSGGLFTGHENTFGGQRNGLCGAAEPGFLFLRTGLHAGDVHFTVELHDEEPALDDTWDEVVEVSFQSAGAVALTAWGGMGSWPLDLPPAAYRVRYHGRKLDEAHKADPPDPDAELVHRHLLQFWPAEPTADAILRQSSAVAAYWHDTARQAPLPPTAEERAEAARQEQLEWERKQEGFRLATETRGWGGVLPSDRLRAMGGMGMQLAELDRPIVDALDLVDAATQRVIARWAVRRAYAKAGLDRLDWIAAELDAMDRGEAPAEDFSNGGAGWDRMWSDPRTVHTTIVSPAGTAGFSQQSMAFPALVAAADPDPLRAVVDAVRTAANTYGQGHTDEFFVELRRQFPVLR